MTLLMPIMSFIVVEEMDIQKKKSQIKMRSVLGFLGTQCFRSTEGKKLGKIHRDDDFAVGHSTR